MSRAVALFLVAAMCLSAQAVNYTYDSGGRVVRADYGGGSVFVYTYDAAGHLISRQPLSASSPLLTISAAHQGNFARGQRNAQYTITVSNAASAGPTSAMYTVADSLPSGLSLVSMAGTGWNCTGNSCSRGDLLNSGISYSAITVTVNVASTATSPAVNAVALSTNGSTIGTAKDLTVITTPSPCAITGDGLPTVADVQAVIDMALGAVPATTAADLNGDGVVNVADVQVIINVVLGTATCSN